MSNKTSRHPPVLHPDQGGFLPGLQCHVPQANAKPLIENRYQSSRDLAK